MAKKSRTDALKPKRHHGYAVLLFILGTLFPPLAVAARFGIGSDFWLNLLLTIAGYIPGHGHNFYIQNIRNNKNHARTPKWAQRYGLVDTSEIKRKERKSQWQSRYNDRLPRSTLEGAPYAEGQDAASSVDLSSDGHQPAPRTNTNGELWRPEDENYYNNNNDSSSGGGGRWHYPANFDDVATPSKSSSKKKKKSDKKDRWARTEDAHSLSEEQTRKKSKRKKSKSSMYSDSNSTTEFPEAAEGGLYGERPGVAETRQPARQTTTDDVFSHEF
ncbi:hypothetical protein R3P38DRAFT_2998032 [Favolaschia claudopus]|uniref:Uncharacterized protein n=1 Tax=Favolaschia claudopus TaxID=2862362 RepID=A0AAW0AQS8_9AGAR